jgi:hypothetical protein
MTDVSEWRSKCDGRAITHSVNQRIFQLEFRVRANVSLYGIRGGQSHAGTGFSSESFGLFCQYHSTVAVYLLIFYLGMDMESFRGAVAQRHSLTPSQQ